MILFVGNEEKGFFVREIAERHGWETVYVLPSLSIEQQAQEILRWGGCKYIIYDIEQYTDDSEVIADVINRIRIANNAVPIIYASGYNQESDIVKFLLYKEIQYFIFASYLDEKKQELENCIRGIQTYNLNSADSLNETEELQKDSGIPAAYKTIGIAGVVNRIGTTTQAIQIVKYLLYKGYTACYIQMNTHGWVEELAAAYTGVEEQEELGRATYQGVDMFYKLEKLPDVMKRGYDFYVYDYGVYRERDFNKVSFLEKDLEMFMVGTKPGEFMRTYELIENNFYNNVIYIFNFIPDDKEEREDIYDLMQDKKDMTFFAEECRDPFRFVPSDFYEKVIPVTSIAKTKPKEKKPFWKKRK